MKTKNIAFLFVSLLILTLILTLILSSVSATEIRINRITRESRDIIVNFSAVKNDTRKYLVKAELICDGSSQIKKFYARKKNILYNFTAEFNLTGNNCLLIIDGLDKRIECDFTADRNIRIERFEVIPDYNLGMIFLEIRGNTTDFDLRTMIYKNEKLIYNYKRNYILMNKRIIEQDFTLNPGYYIVKEEILVDGLIRAEKEERLEVSDRNNLDKNDTENIKDNINIVNETESKENNKSPSERNRINNKTNKNIITISSGTKGDITPTNKKTNSELSPNFNLSVALYTFLFLSILLNIVLIIKR